MKPEDIHWLDEEQTEEPEEMPEDTEESEEKEEEVSQPSDSAAPSRKKPKLWIIILIFFVAAVAVFFLSGGYDRFFGGEKARTLTQATDPIDYAADSFTHIRPFEGMAINAGIDGVKVYKTNGEMLWDQPYTMTTPYLCVSGPYAAVADLGERHILLLNKDGLVSDITTESTLLYCTVNPTGCTAVIMENAGSNILAVYDKDGNVLVRRVTYSDLDGIPVSIAINDDATSMATSYAIYTETSLRSAVTLFNLTDTAADSIDRIAGNYNYTDTLVTDLCYMDDMLFVVGDNKLAGIRTSGNTAEVWSEDLSYQITSFGFGDDYLAVHLGSGLIGVAGEPENDFLIIGQDGSHRLEQKTADFRSVWVSNDTAIVQDGFDYTALNKNGEALWSMKAETGMQLWSLTDKLAFGNTGSALQFFKVVTTDEEVNS